jgi:hypothetical protein
MVAILEINLWDDEKEHHSVFAGIIILGGYGADLYR